MAEKNCGICLDHINTELDLPSCAKCRYKFHFGKCSGIDAASWPKSGADSKKRWTCHVCNPSKNLSKSNSGVFVPSDFAGVSHFSGAPSDMEDDTEALPQPDPLPQFANSEEKTDYMLSQLSTLVAQNAMVLRELQRARDVAADAKRLAEVNAFKISQLEEQSRIDYRTISELQYKNRALEDYSRVDNVIIHGLPHPKTEAAAFGIVFAVGKAVGQEVTYNNLSACHSLGRPQNGIGRIVCRFGQRWLRNRFQSAINEKKITTAQLDLTNLEITDTNGEPTKIYATDHISPQTSQLYSEAKRLLAARFGGDFHQVFVRKRKVFARRTVDTPVKELRFIDHVRCLAGQREQTLNETTSQQSHGLSLTTR